MGCSLERVVRPAPTERLARTENGPPAGEGRALPPGKDERRNRWAGTKDVPTGANGNTLDCERTGTGVPPANTEERLRA